MNSNPLHDSRISRLIEHALIEDIGQGDVTSDAVIPDHTFGAAIFTAKAPGIIAGLEVADLVFRHIDENLAITPLVPEGKAVQPGECIGSVHGPAKSILRGERVALNFLQRMSGIATLTRQFVEAVEGTSACITDTRKTAPGLRALDKLAVAVGGGVNHRFGLDDMVLIKDNHIAAAGGIVQAIERCFKYLKQEELDLPVEIETRSVDEVRAAISCFESGKKFTRIMLDNYRTEAMKEAVNFIAHRVEVEASGNVTLQNVRAIAETGVDFISVGALTHSVHALDISLELTLGR